MTAREGAAYKQTTLQTPVSARASEPIRAAGATRQGRSRRGVQSACEIPRSCVGAPCHNVLSLRRWFIHAAGPCVCLIDARILLVDLGAFVPGRGVSRRALCRRAEVPVYGPRTPRVPQSVALFCVSLSYYIRGRARTGFVYMYGRVRSSCVRNTMFE